MLVIAVVDNNSGYNISKNNKNNTNSVVRKLSVCTRAGRQAGRKKIKQKATKRTLLFCLFRFSPFFVLTS